MLQQAETTIEPNTPVSVITESEQTLTTEIAELWSNHETAKGNARRTATELKELRAQLAAKLYTLKQMLAKPGRAGQWSGFLDQHGYPRTTADRLVASHARSLAGNENRTTGAIPDEAAVERTLQTAIVRLTPVLKGDIVRFGNFVQRLAAACEVEFGPQVRTDGPSEPICS